MIVVVAAFCWGIILPSTRIRLNQACVHESPVDTLQTSESERVLVHEFVVSDSGDYVLYYFFGLNFFLGSHRADSPSIDSAIARGGSRRDNYPFPGRSREQAALFGV